MCIVYARNLKPNCTTFNNVEERGRHGKSLEVRRRLRYCVSRPVFIPKQRPTIVLAALENTKRVNHVPDLFARKWNVPGGHSTRRDSPNSSAYCRLRDRMARSREYQFRCTANEPRPRFRT